jgi:hypothetical protein
MTKAAELAKMGEILTNSQIGGRRNIVINGAMQISQRGTSETGVGGSSGYFTLDRYKIVASGTAGRVTMSQSTDAPNGFSNSLKLDCTTADTSIASGEYFFLSQYIEGQDVQQLKKGTSDAEKVTVSFYVKGNASATYTLELEDADNSRQNSQEFSVTTSWTRVVKTFVGDTTGTLNNDNGNSLNLNIILHSGSDLAGGTHTSNAWHSTANQRAGDNLTSIFDSTDREFFITGLQIEVGEQATPFEHRSFGEELLLCQRYFQDFAFSGTNFFTLNPLQGSANRVPMPQFAPPMRTAPTFVFRDLNNNTGFLSEFSAGTQTSITSLAEGTNTAIGTGIGGGYLNLGRSLSNPINMCFKADAEL